MDEVARRLISGLEADAALVDRGHFSIDDDAARSKLAQYRLAEPHAWLALLVEGASLLGARTIDVVTELDAITLRFDGAPLGATGIFSEAAQAEGDKLTHRKFAIAFTTLFDQLGVAAIEVGSPRERVRLLPRGPSEPLPGVAERNLIRVCGLATTREPATLSSGRCRYSPLRIVVDYQLVSAGMRQWMADVGATSIEALEDGDRRIGWVGRGSTKGAMLLTHGVFAERLELAQGLAILDVPLPKDLGEQSVLRGPEFQRILDLVEAKIATLPELGSALAEHPLAFEPQRLPAKVEPEDHSSTIVFTAVFLALCMVLAVVFG